MRKGARRRRHSEALRWYRNEGNERSQSLSVVRCLLSIVRCLLTKRKVRLDYCVAGGVDDEGGVGEHDAFGKQEGVFELKFGLHVHHLKLRE